MATITILCNDGKCQTSASTIEPCPKLHCMIDNNTKSIKIGISLRAMQLILDYLRGYYTHSILRKYPDEAKILGLLDESDLNFVHINIGGKHYYRNKNELSKLHFFNKFFEYNKDKYPDFTDLLIDRSPIIFEEMMKYLKRPSGSPLTPTIISDLEFYNYDDPSDEKYNRRVRNSISYHINESYFDTIYKFGTVYKKTMKTPITDTNIIVEENNYILTYSDYQKIPKYIFLYLNPDTIFDTMSEEYIEKVMYNDICINDTMYHVDKKNAFIFIDLKQIIYKYHGTSDTVNLALTINKKLSIGQVSYIDKILFEKTYQRGTKTHEKKIQLNINDSKHVDINFKKLLPDCTFYIHNILFSASTEFDIANIQITNQNGDVVASIPKVFLLKKSFYNLELCCNLMGYAKYCFDNEHDLNIRINFTKQITCDFNLHLDGRIYLEAGDGSENYQYSDSE